MPDHNNIASAEQQRVLREIQRRNGAWRNGTFYTEQQLADLVGISVEENTRRREERELRAAESIQAQQREGHNPAARRSVVQTPRGSSYIDLEGSTFADYHAANRYIISVNQSRPIHADFESSYQYQLFLNSKYKHHHKCTTCLSVFRCGQAKCDRTLCRVCDLSNQLSATTWPTDTAVTLSFNGSSGGSWTNTDTGHEVVVAYDEATQWQAVQDTVVTADFEAAERSVLAGTSVLADLAPERNTEEES